MFDAETDITKDISLRDKLLSCLTRQISEYELLKSMYPEPGEIVLSDPKVLAEISQFVGGSLSSSGYTPAHLEFVINLTAEKIKLELFCNLPSFYPDEEPDICVRCNQLNRLQESGLNNELSVFIRENHQCEVCLYTIVSWLQENIHSFTALDGPVDLCENSKPVDDNKFVRYWIYSHHIYNKKKREDILGKAKDLNITGFCLPGKPGIICIEGLDSYCKEWWKEIKSMNWKKIVIRKSEVFELVEETKQRKFNKFEELHFSNTAAKQSKHADMKKFFKYMELVGLTHAFNDFFGLCNDNLS